MHTQEDTQLIQSVLNFWFVETPKELWFAKNEDFDQSIQDRYGELYEKAKKGDLDHWTDTAEGCLALIIVLDQFPRNMFRNDSQTYGTDSKAGDITKLALGKGYDKEPKVLERRSFMYMPLMHSEDLEDQELCVKLFQDLPDGLPWAVHHRDIVKQFGRFPHRNKLMGRESTPEEIAYLNNPENDW